MERIVARCLVLLIIALTFSGFTALTALWWIPEEPFIIAIPIGGFLTTGVVLIFLRILTWLWTGDWDQEE